MRNILALVGAGTVTFLGLGWYLGWYNIDRGSQPGLQSVKVEINPEKISTDVKKGVVAGTEFIEDLRNGADKKPASLTTPQGPASSFFAPPAKDTSSPPQTSFAPPSGNKLKTPANDDDAIFGIRIPGK